MASRACAAAVLLADPAVRAAAARIDWPALVALALSAPASKRSVANPRETNAGVTEILLSGPQADPLLTWLEAQPNPADGGCPYCAALSAFREASEDAARRMLATDLGWTRTQAAQAVFANHSLLVRIDAGVQPGQAPHIDVMYSGAQFLTALSSDCRPTMVYSGSLDSAQGEGRQGEGRQRGALGRAMAPLLLPRKELEAGMAPAHGEALQVGDMVGLSGPVVHGGPPTDDGETRVVAFMSCSLPGLRGYDQDEQLLPWVYRQERGDVDAFCASVLEWRDLQPWEHYPSRRKGERGTFIREEIEKLCAGKPHKMHECF